MKLPKNCLHYSERVGSCWHKSNKHNSCKGIKTCLLLNLSCTCFLSMLYCWLNKLVGGMNSCLFMLTKLHTCCSYWVHSFLSQSGKVQSLGTRHNGALGGIIPANRLAGDGGQQSDDRGSDGIQSSKDLPNGLAGRIICGNESYLIGQPYSRIQPSFPVWECFSLASILRGRI